MLRTLFAVVVVVGLSQSVQAVEPAASPTRSKLRDFGLGSMQVLSDAEGQAIRGQGISGFVYGAPNGYFKTLGPNHFASGSNFVISSGSFSFGKSMAFAK